MIIERIKIYSIFFLIKYIQSHEKYFRGSIENVEMK